MDHLALSSVASRVPDQEDTSATYFSSHKEFAAQELLEVLPLYLVLAVSIVGLLL